jgi:hypothetical protein
MQTLTDTVKLPRAKAVIQHFRPKRDKRTGKPIPYRWVDAKGRKHCRRQFKQPKGDWRIDPKSAELVNEETSHNVITTVGRDFLHTQGYGTSPAGNGLNYIALSNDTLSETTASTTLSTEIAASGLTRAQGTVTHTAGQNTTTVAKTFTCATAPQAAQKAALFTASSGGTMNHALAFTQRSLQIGDTLAVTFTITVG